MAANYTEICTVGKLEAVFNKFYLIHCNLVLTRVLGSKKADRVSGDYSVIILGVPTIIISSSNNVYPTHQYCDLLKCWFQCMYCWQKEKYVLDQ